jgi:hypothetical protein
MHQIDRDNLDLLNQPKAHCFSIEKFGRHVFRGWLRWPRSSGA